MNKVKMPNTEVDRINWININDYEKKCIQWSRLSNNVPWHSPQWLRIFSTMLAQNTKYTFKTSKMDQITLECWYNSFLGLLRADGRGFLHQNPILKKVRQTRNQQAAHAQKRVTVPLSIRADWSRIGVEKKLENILDGSLTNLSSSVKWISYCEWLASKLAIRK